MRLVFAGPNGSGGPYLSYLNVLLHCVFFINVTTVFLQKNSNSISTGPHFAEAFSAPLPGRKDYKPMFSAVYEAFHYVFKCDILILTVPARLPRHFISNTEKSVSHWTEDLRNHFVNSPNTFAS